MTQIKDIEGRTRRKAVYALTHNKPSPLFSLSRKRIFEMRQDYVYTRDGITLTGEEALEAVREDVTLALEAFGYKSKHESVKRNGYSLTCESDVVQYLRAVIKLNRWILPNKRY